MKRCKSLIMVAVSIIFAGNLLAVDDTIVYYDSFEDGTVGQEPVLHSVDSTKPWTYIAHTGVTGFSPAVIENDTTGTIFGLAGNKYFDISSPDLTSGVGVRAEEIFSLNLLTFNYKLYEPSDGGSGTMTFKLGVDNLALGEVAYSFLIGDGKIKNVLAYSLDKSVDIAMVVNSSGENVEYEKRTLASGKMDIWIDQAYKMTIDCVASWPTSNTNLASFRMEIFNSSEQQILLDDFTVRNTYYVNDPSSGTLIVIK